MSKQSEAKEKQGYRPKANPNLCGNCTHFKFDHLIRVGGDKKANLRCDLGGFKVSAKGDCNEWAAK
jgi:hypothetical protein